ncbi:WecB/TagA/CpsF family glycosyltransferase [Spirulina major]|uniref:WecB/TagA/CpsF family glycosyltransferase n=1 Tax=Spirulina major TaxID=270636 RepID=UPI000A013F90|nr:WecB/TagA/CpsF family glycosyltransferase [Spirulina major]
MVSIREGSGPVQNSDLEFYIPNVGVIGSPVTAMSLESQISTVMQWAKAGWSKGVFAANVHMLMEAHWNPEFAKILQQADLVTPDGMPLVWVMKQLGLSQQDRVTGSDLFQYCCDQAQHEDVSVSFVGSDAETLEKMRDRLEKEYPKLAIAGMEPLPFRPLTPAEDQELIERINASGAGLVFVALGCPKQERWIIEHRGKINAVMLGVGAVFPFYAGTVQRAPERMQQLGLEWLHRLQQEPKRLWKRYAGTIPPFVLLAAKQIALQAQAKLQDPKQPIHQYRHAQPIGELLQKAGLLTAEQVQEILADKERYPNLQFGQILAQRGWLKPETVDFLIEHLPQLPVEDIRQPIGMYLKLAGLLDDEQVQEILEAQNQEGLRFGEIAAQKGWLKQETVDWIVNSMNISTPLPTE